MNKPVLHLLLLCVLLCGQSRFVDAQAEVVSEAPPLSAIDFSSAEIDQAGPAAFYIRGVGLPDRDVSLRVALDSEGAWTVTDVVAEDENLLPPDVVLDFTTISALDATRLEVDGIIYGGRIYSGVLDFTASGISSFEEIIRRGTLSDREITYPETLRDLLLGRQIERHQEEISAIRSNYEERLSAIREQYEAAVREQERLSAENRSLSTQVASLRQENNALRSEISELEARLSGVAEGEGVPAALARDYLDRLEALEEEIAGLRREILRLQSLLSENRTSTAPTVPAPIGRDGEAAPTASREEPLTGAAETEVRETEVPETETPETAAPEAAVPESRLPYPDGPRADVRGEEVPPAAPETATESLPYREGPGVLSLVPAEERPPEAREPEDAPTPTDRAAETGAADETAAAAETEGADGEEPDEATPATRSDVEDALRRRIRELEGRNRELSAEKAAIEQEVRATLLRDGFIAALRPSLGAVVLDSLETAEAQLGAWQVIGNAATQRDPEMLFGKLVLPLDQGTAPVLYSFDARSNDSADEWVGFGLHIYVADVEKKGYGLGDSLLVWLTRDREVYKTDKTHLQLYRSDDDINMGRVMDAVITDPITDYVGVEVLYEPVRQYITIAVDGVEKIRYKTWFGIDEGLEIALRTLGTAEFRNLTVHTRR